nr:sialidase-like [Penaeus vannamei]
MLPRGWLHFLVVLLRSSMAGIPLAMASLMTVADRGLHTMARGIPLRTSTMGPPPLLSPKKEKMHLKARENEKPALSPSSDKANSPSWSLTKVSHDEETEDSKSITSGKQESYKPLEEMEWPTCFPAPPSSPSSTGSSPSREYLHEISPSPPPDFRHETSPLPPGDHHHNTATLPLSHLRPESSPPHPRPPHPSPSGGSSSPNGLEQQNSPSPPPNFRCGMSPRHGEAPVVVKLVSEAHQKAHRSPSPNGNRRYERPPSPLGARHYDKPASPVGVRRFERTPSPPTDYRWVYVNDLQRQTSVSPRSAASPSSGDHRQSSASSPSQASVIMLSPAKLQYDAISHHAPRPVVPPASPNTFRLPNSSLYGQSTTSSSSTNTSQQDSSSLILYNSSPSPPLPNLTDQDSPLSPRSGDVRELVTQRAVTPPFPLTLDSEVYDTPRTQPETPRTSYSNPRAQAETPRSVYDNTQPLLASREDHRVRFACEVPDVARSTPVQGRDSENPPTPPPIPEFFENDDDDEDAVAPTPPPLPKFFDAESSPSLSPPTGEDTAPVSPTHTEIRHDVSPPPQSEVQYPDVQPVAEHKHRCLLTHPQLSVIQESPSPQSHSDSTHDSPSPPHQRLKTPSPPSDRSGAADTEGSPLSSTDGREPESPPPQPHFHINTESPPPQPPFDIHTESPPPQPQHGKDDESSSSSATSPGAMAYSPKEEKTSSSSPPQSHSQPTTNEKTKEKEKSPPPSSSEESSSKSSSKKDGSSSSSAKKEESRPTSPELYFSLPDNWPAYPPFLFGDSDFPPP